jgi:hypothetical protein
MQGHLVRLKTAGMEDYSVWHQQNIEHKNY